MSDKPYNLTQALMQTVETGCPASGVEREFHFEALRTIEKSRILSGRAASSGHPSLYVPFNLLHRDLSVTGGPSTGSVFVGLKTYGRSDLANFSAVVDAGAVVVTGLKENATFWQVSSLATPTWNSETGGAANNRSAIHRLPMQATKTSGNHACF